VFPFRYRHERTGKWVRARWKATAEEIAARGGEITGPAEIIEDRYGSGFQPYRLMTHAEIMRTMEPQPDVQPVIDACERFLLAVFLRRLVTYNARRRRFAEMEGAALLYRQMVRSAPT
jgi:hypothetical protein